MSDDRITGPAQPGRSGLIPAERREGILSTPPAREPLVPPAEETARTTLETARSAFWTALGGLGFISGAAFLIFWLLAWTRHVPPGEPLAITGGVMLLVTGLFSLREAFSTTDPHAKWGRSDVPCGRLTSFAFGLGFCAIGVTFLSHGWLTDRIVPGLLFVGAFVASFILSLVGSHLDEGRYGASRTAIRRRGWLLASLRAEDDLPADEVQRRRAARAELRLSIQGRLTGRTTWEWAETQCRCLEDPARDRATPTDWPEAADEWRAFRSAASEGDQLWEFNTVSARGGRDSGEEGFALLRDGTVVDWFITRIVG